MMYKFLDKRSATHIGTETSSDAYFANEQLAKELQKAIRN